jgi:hypothetical protein
MLVVALSGCGEVQAPREAARRTSRSLEADTRATAGNALKQTLHLTLAANNEATSATPASRQII